SGIQHRERSRVECHPMSGKASPDYSGRVSASSTRSFGHEQEEIHDGIPSKPINHVAHPVRRSLEDDLPQIPPVHVSHQSLRHEYGRKPDYENSNVQKPEERFRCHALPHDCSKMNPQAHNEADSREANEKPDKRSQPVWDGAKRIGIDGSGCAVLQDSLNIQFEQHGTRRLVGVVANCDRLALKITHELIGLAFGWKVSPVVSRICSPGCGVRISEFRDVIAALGRERKRWLAHFDRLDTPVSNRPSSSFPSFEPTPRWNRPPSKHDCQPEPDHPRPTRGISPSKLCRSKHRSAIMP